MVGMASEPGSEVVFSYRGGACVIALTQGCTLVFDPGDLLSDEEIAALSGMVAVLFTQSLDDHFHARTTMKLVSMKGALVIGTSDVCKEVADFVPSSKLVELLPRRGVRVGPLRVFAIEGKHEVPVNLYYVTWGPSLLFAGDTGYVPLSKLKVQLAFLPAGGSSFASPESSVRMALDLEARYVVPIHGSGEEAKQVEELLSGKAEVIIPVPRREYVVKL